MKRLFPGCAIAALLLLTVPCALADGERFQVYFVTVGSGWYAPAPSKDVHGFSEIDGANKSATLVGDGLVSGGAVYGVELTADDGHFVTIGDIDRAIKRVASKIKIGRAHV